MAIIFQGYSYQLFPKVSFITPHKTTTNQNTLFVYGVNQRNKRTLRVALLKHS